MKPIKNPDDAIGVHYIEKTPEGNKLRQVGMAATKERLAKGNKSFNAHYDRMIDRVQGILKTSNTPKDLVDALAKDTSKIVLNEAEAARILAMKEAILKMSRAEFIKFFHETLSPKNPLTLFNANAINNSAIAAYMRKMGIDVLPISKFTVVPEGFETGQPYVKYTIDMDAWREAMHLRDNKGWMKSTPDSRQMSSRLDRIRAEARNAAVAPTTPVSTTPKTKTQQWRAEQDKPRPHLPPAEPLPKTPIDEAPKIIEKPKPEEIAVGDTVSWDQINNDGTTSTIAEGRVKDVEGNKITLDVDGQEKVIQANEVLQSSPHTKEGDPIPTKDFNEEFGGGKDPVFTKYNNEIIDKVVIGFYDGKSSEQISKETGVPVGDVKRIIKPSEDEMAGWQANGAIIVTDSSEANSILASMSNDLSSLDSLFKQTKTEQKLENKKVEEVAKKEEVRSVEEKTNEQRVTEDRPRSILEYTGDRANKHMASIIGDGLKDLSPDSSRAKELIELRKNVEQENVISKAKEIATKNGKENDEISKREFTKHFVDMFEKAGLRNPILNADGTVNQSLDRTYKRLFIVSAYSKPKSVLVYKNGKYSKETRPSKEPSYLDDRYDELARLDPKYKGLETIHYEPKEAIAQERRLWSQEDWDESRVPDAKRASEGMMDNGYIMMWASGNKSNTIAGVKYVPEMIGLTDPGSINVKANRDAFIRKFFKDVVGFNEDVPVDSIIKRSKLFNSYEMSNPIKGQTFTNIVFKSPTMSDMSLIPKDSFGENTTENAKLALSVKNLFDGKIFVTKQLFDDILQKGNYLDPLVRLKPTFAVKLPNGLVVQKGDLAILDGVLLDHFEKKLGRPIKKNDIITFEDNIKEGLANATDRTAPSGEKYKTLATPSEAWRFKYAYEHEPSASFSLSNVISKFSNTDGLNGTFKSLFGPEIQKFRRFEDDMKAANTGEEILSVLKKYPEYGKADWDESLYGKLKGQVEAGADMVAIGFNVEKLVGKVLQDYVLAGGFLKGDHLTLTPDFGFKLDKNTGKRSFLSPNEVVMGQETFVNMFGKQALNELRSYFKLR